MKEVSPRKKMPCEMPAMSHSRKNATPMSRVPAAAVRSRQKNRRQRRSMSIMQPSAPSSSTR